eukprot:TRINITY_DN12167_c0_g5_i1.p1 TRINITY_DN12167_c0_g5~~TRINITY_DN12167_c0_g5_i1.p1  ORF type:complete len:664 (-),score=129.25 TRINITY_DN12167_c0_g5_i1:142-2133(-)
MASMAEWTMADGVVNTTACRALPHVESPDEFDATLWVIFGLYMLAITGVVAYTAIKECLAKRATGRKDIADHYLAGKALGPVSLGLSMVASNFSGYTTVGIPADSFLNGFQGFRWLGSVALITVVFTLYAPRMHFLSRHRKYKSIMEYIWDRYSIRDPRRDPLHWLMVLGMLIPCLVYLVAQFDAFGSTINTLSGGAVGRLHSMLVLMVLIVVFESLGGLKAVALTDVIQGGILLLGAFCIPLFLDSVFGGLPDISACLTSFRPEAVAVPSREEQLGWYDFMFALAVGRSLCPDLITRAMAADSQRTLKTSTILLNLSGFAIQIPFCLLGIVGSIYHTELYTGDKAAANDVFAAVTLDIVGSGTVGSLVGSIMMAASIAAIMSTADSVLIAASHIIVLDIIKPFRVKDVHVHRRAGDEGTEDVKAEVDDRRLVLIARVITFAAAALCIPVAAVGINLSFLASVQLALMAQIFPAFVISMYSQRVTHSGAFCGLLLGLISVIMSRSYSILGGALMSSALNLLVTGVVSLLTYKEAPCKGEDKEEIMDFISWRTPQLAGYTSEAAAKRLGKCKEGDAEDDSQDTSSTKVDDFAGQSSREPICSAWYMFCIALVFWVCGVPFYHDESAVGAMFMGWPAWTLQSLASWMCCALSIVAAIIWGWSDGL